MQPTRAGQSGIQSRAENGLAFLQQRPDMFEGERLQKIFWSNAGPVGKKPVKMKLTQADALSDRVQVRLRGVMSIEVADNGGNAFVIVHARRILPYRRRSTRFLLRFSQIQPARTSCCN